jgi:hypothetical protein
LEPFLENVLLENDEAVLWITRELLVQVVVEGAPWSGGTYDRWFLSSSTSTIFIMRMRILVAVGVGESSFSLKFLLLQCD